MKWSIKIFEQLILTTMKIFMWNPIAIGSMWQIKNNKKYTYETHLFIPRSNYFLFGL